ncbi:MAG: TrmH family RNA methyltransferase [Gemmatimonadaceae bacterium]
MTESLLANVKVVLFETQDVVNVAGTVRAMKNMGTRDLRLVRPVQYDLNQIEGIAHGTRDVAERIRHFDGLDTALEDCVRVAGFTARRRAAKRVVVEPREAAEELLSFAREGPVAMLFGREDDGLPNDALDRAHLVVTIPTTEHASLNLAQAVLLGLYEVHLRAADATRPLAPAKNEAPPSASAEYEQYFRDAERALSAIDFFKTRNSEMIMRTLRSLTFRAAPDKREIGLLRAMSIEVLRSIDRVRKQAGLPPIEASPAYTPARAKASDGGSRAGAPARPDLAAELLRLAAEDKRVAKALTLEGVLEDGYHLRMEAVHRANAERLRAIIAEHGWPGRALVGDEGAKAAWLVAQHAIGEPDFQRECLRLLQEASARADAPRWMAAYLEDRIAFHEGRPQRYGTQLVHDDEGLPVPYDIASPDEVNALRRAAGLEPLSAAIRRHRERATRLTAPPEKRAQKERDYQEWLRRVGWRK